jgi:protein-S-isoprenylcysteine O-methyltransferase Ste14
MKFAANDAGWQGAMALYFPVVAALLAGLLRRSGHGCRPRLFAACLLSFLWSLVTLLALQRLNQFAGWWTFPDSAASFCGMPIELYLGWIVLWGILPQLAFPQLPLTWGAAVMIGLDLVMMPLCSSVVHLGRHWLIGEAVAVALVLIPALCIARWTLNDTHPRLRAALQVATSGLLFLFFFPELIFALRPGPGWTPILRTPSWQLQLELQLLAFLAVPGVSAVMEFAQRGDGTPIPYDPPERLVISGIYRYVANPMQLSCTLVMLLWAAMLRNGWVLIAAGITILYSAGIARWDEHQDLASRFGDDWREYRRHVYDWLPRWRPYRSGKPALLYIAISCDPCSQLLRWIEHRSPLGMQILDAAEWPFGSIWRMTYDPNDGTPPVNGVRAMGRALEHLNFGWALAGTTLRLPGAWQIVQLLMDASGLGPRDVSSACRSSLVQK